MIDQIQFITAYVGAHTRACVSGYASLAERGWVGRVVRYISIFNKNELDDVERKLVREKKQSVCAGVCV